MPLTTFIVLPTYNEGENIIRLVPALFDLDVADLQVLVVDDNSPDGTGEIVETLAEQADYAGRLHVLRRPEKQGLAPAYIQGFTQALSMGADYVIQMDADLSHQPKYIPGLLRQAQEYDIVIGSRYADGGSVDEGWGPLRKLLSWWGQPRLYAGHPAHPNPRRHRRLSHLPPRRPGRHGYGTRQSQRLCIYGGDDLRGLSAGLPHRRDTDSLSRSAARRLKNVQRHRLGSRAAGVANQAASPAAAASIGSERREVAYPAIHKTGAN